MFIKTIPNKTSVYQVITPMFNGIGHIPEHNTIYTKLIPHDVEQVLEDYPATVLHEVYIPTNEITVIIKLYE
jgi:hypothetical protein